MVTSSTEYAITKKGMSPPIRKRDKPLRTYGKRQPQPAATTTSEEPPAKKRRRSEIEGEGVLVTKENTAAQSTVQSKGGVASPDQTAPGRSTGAKGSILSYFKRVEVQPVKVQKTEVPHEEAEEEAGVSAPRAKRRRTRILRVRTTSTGTSETEEAPEDAQEESSKAKQADARSKRAPLEETATTGNKQQEPERSKSAKRTSAPSVQMTLNISPQAAFSECKVCDTVWNPLYPDDVKYHQKRHAAVLRKSRTKRGIEEL